MENTNQIPNTSRCEPVKLYKKSSLVDIYKSLQSLRSSETLCDIKLETDDRKIINAHKVVLSANSPYFYAMFSNFSERNQGVVLMKHFDSTALQQLVEFFYSGQIEITEKNVQTLLPGANILQLQEVTDACSDFLQSQLCPSNCIGINAFADLHNCTNLTTISEVYIHQHFSEVYKHEEFLSLTSDGVIKLISNDRLPASFEETIFQSVISWVNHKLDSRQCILPQLMENIRFPLMIKDYVFNHVVEEPLIQSSSECLELIHNVMQKYLFDVVFNPQSIPNKPRHGEKVILAVGGIGSGLSNSLEWFDTRTNLWHFGPELITNHRRHSLVVILEKYVYDVGGFAFGLSPYQCVHMLDISSKSLCWQQCNDMLVERQLLGIGVINNIIYAVGGYNDRDGDLCSAEVYDYNTQQWHMISNMSTTRCSFGVGVLDDYLYVVGGNDQSRQPLATVECYIPSVDIWSPVANMCERRSGAGVGVLYGEMYVVGGDNGSNILSSVEKYNPKTNVWTCIADMLLPRKYAEVVALDGLLFAVGGMNESSILESVECYDPNTNTWARVTAKWNIMRFSPGVVAIDRPQHCMTC